MWWHQWVDSSNVEFYIFSTSEFTTQMCYCYRKWQISVFFSVFLILIYILCFWLAVPPYWSRIPIQSHVIPLSQSQGVLLQRRKLERRKCPPPCRWHPGVGQDPLWLAVPPHFDLHSLPLVGCSPSLQRASCSSEEEQPTRGRECRSKWGGHFHIWSGTGYW